MGQYFNLEHGGGRTSKHSMGSYKVMSCPLVLLLSLGFVLASVSADPRSFLDVTQSEVYQQLASLPRENLLRIIIHFLEDEDLEKIGIKNMGELQETVEKRAPFSSWGGKRTNIDEFDEFDENEIPKRASFSSWGGKRAPLGIQGDKRAPLGSLKRAPIGGLGKRAPLGGLDQDLYLQKRGGSSFSAWGGKRSAELADYIKAHLAARSRRDDSPIKVIRPARAAFSAWGGK